MLYQIAHLGDADGEPEFSSAMQLEEGETFFFAPRPLKNLVQVDELESLSPIMSCQIADLAGEDTPQLYVACGRGPRSSLRVLRHGLEVSRSHDHSYVFGIQFLLVVCIRLLKWLYLSCQATRMLYGLLRQILQVCGNRVYSDMHVCVL